MKIENTQNGNILHVSEGNRKMGTIKSVSLPAGITCPRNAPCYKYCYARKMETLRKNCKGAYIDNLSYYNADSCGYFGMIDNVLKGERFFRWNVSGDLPDYMYFAWVVAMADRNKHCNMLLFTKQYAIVNQYCDSMPYSKIPENLHVIFSVVDGLEVVNPYNFPTCHIRYKD